MAKSKEIDSADFIPLTITEALAKYPEPLRTAWLELSTNRLYVSATLADLKMLYLAGKRLEQTAKHGLPIIEHGGTAMWTSTGLKKYARTRQTGSS